MPVETTHIGPGGGGDGVYESGDFIVLRSASPLSPIHETSASTTGTEWVDCHTGWNKSFGMDGNSIEFPEGSDGNTYVKAGITVSTGGTMSYRMYDYTNDTPISGTEANGLSSGSPDEWSYFETPVAQYNVPLNEVQFAGQFRSDTEMFEANIYTQRNIYVMTMVE